MISVFFDSTKNNKISRIKILNVVKKYGFTECANIINFLQYVCARETLDIAELRFIHSQINDCLRQHAVYSGKYHSADFMDYFQELKTLKDQLNFIISVNNK